MRKRAGRLVAVTESLSELSDSLGTASPRALSWVFDHWSEAAGEEVSRHARPERIDGETLFVSVDSPAWASRLRTVAPKVLERIGQLAGDNAPSQLVVRVRAQK